MTLDLILPWFPIILSAAVGARLIGGGRAGWLGVTCAVFWVIVVQTTTGVPFWADAVTAAGLLAGSAAIVGMAHWSGRQQAGAISPGSGQKRRSPPAGDAPVAADAESLVTAQAISRFNDWLEANRYSMDAWPGFDEFVAGNLLFTTCQGRHVRTYRILSEGDYMVPLRVIDSGDDYVLTSARRGIEGHVATTGRSYYEGDQSQGELVCKLAGDQLTAPAWCFSVRQGARTIGLVSVSQLDGASVSRALLRGMELLVGQFWGTLNEVCRGRAAASTDKASGLMTRQAFLDEARRVSEQSYSHGEPVAVVVVAVEGLRALLDRGRWDLADDVVQWVSKTLRDRVRPDDLLGRFDDARFLLLLRRVDSELASLIANQLAERLSRMPLVEAIPDGTVGIRCGVAGSGNGAPAIGHLVAAAVRLCNEAREREVGLACDLAQECEATGVDG